MKRFVAILLVALMLCVSFAALAHPGRTDSYGGHWDTKNGTYHDHNSGSSSGTQATPRPSATGKATPRPTTIPFLLIDNEDDLLYGKTSAASVTMYADANKKAKQVGVLKTKGTAVEIIEKVYDNSKELWYHIWFSGKDAYVPAKSIKLMSYERFVSGK